MAKAGLSVKRIIHLFLAKFLNGDHDELGALYITITALFYNDAADF